MFNLKTLWRNRQPDIRPEPDLSTIHASRLWQLGELSASLAHDLGQPLNIIRLTAESALDALAGGRAEPERLRRNLETVIDQSRRTQAMMDALMAASRRPSVPPVPLAPAEILDEALAAVQTRIQDQNIRLILQTEPQMQTVMGHAVRLKAALTQILINASEALAVTALRREAGEPGTLTVSCSNDTAQVVYIIADNGPGFPPELRATLESPFPRVVPRGKGCGLGLAVALGVIGEMQGTLTITNANPGTRVEIRLPALPVRKSDTRSLVLVCDDLEAMQATAQSLEERGWPVRLAGSAEQALTLFRSEAADAVVTHLPLAGGDGLDLIARLHALSPDLPIIAITVTHGDEAKQAVAAGAVVVLSQPANPDEIVEELESAAE